MLAIFGDVGGECDAGEQRIGNSRINGMHDEHVLCGPGEVGVQRPFVEEVRILLAAQIEQVVELRQRLLVVDDHLLFLRVDGCKQIEESVRHVRVGGDQLDVLGAAKRYLAPKVHQFLLTTTISIIII